MANLTSNQVLNSTGDCATISIAEIMAQLAQIERQLIPLLITVQRAQGKEPSIVTREQRRKQAVN